MIRVLPKEVSDKIAAGEVIESPVSIVKELIENSIDAGATSISCDIIKGGKEEIRITDNGSGIPKEEVETAFLRHATSKIERAEDLKNLYTLGFRGEALASIAAVSRTELITHDENDNTGTRLIIHGGEILSKEGIGCPIGTTIIVRDLFYNMPARLKFMKSEAAEAGKIIDMMSRLAITRPDIRFSLSSNGKLQFSTSGSGNLKDAILSVYKEKEYKELIPIGLTGQEMNQNFKIYGYISRPSFTRTNRRSQYYFVNGRTVKNSALEKGIDLGYKERLFEGRFPIAFVFLDIDPKQVDVNVHPNKREVRFNDEISVITALEEAVKEAIGRESGVIKASDTYDLDTLNTKTEKDENKDRDKDKGKDKGVKVQREGQVDIKNFLSNINRGDSKSNNRKIYNSSYASEEPAKYNADADPYTDSTLSSSTSFGTPDIDDIGLRPFDFDELNFSGTIFGTYIIATDSDNFYLFDQHAAHERVNYEKFVGAYLNGEKESQVLLTPFTFDVPLEMTVDSAKDEWLSILNKMGYSAELFGENTYIVREIPIFLNLSEAEDFVRTFVDSYNDDLIKENRVVIDKLITKACKASIKANDYIKDREIAALIDELKKCRNPFSCPHGRPTFIKFTKYEIEKMFKRIQ